MVNEQSNGILIEAQSLFSEVKPDCSLGSQATCGMPWPVHVPPTPGFMELKGIVLWVSSAFQCMNVGFWTAVLTHSVLHG